MLKEVRNVVGSVAGTVGYPLKVVGQFAQRQLSEAAYNVNHSSEYEESVKRLKDAYKLHKTELSDMLDSEYAKKGKDPYSLRVAVDTFSAQDLELVDGRSASSMLAKFFKVLLFCVVVSLFFIQIITAKEINKTSKNLTNIDSNYTVVEKLVVIDKNGIVNNDYSTKSVVLEHANWLNRWGKLILNICLGSLLTYEFYTGFIKPVYSGKIRMDERNRGRRNAISAPIDSTANPKTISKLWGNIGAPFSKVSPAPQSSNNRDSVRETSDVKFLPR